MPFLRKGGLRLVQCAGCQMVYAAEVPRALADGSFYDETGGEYLAADKLESDYAEVRFRREVRIFRKFCRRGRVLDVGCSSGGFLHRLKQRFGDDYEIWGTDVSRGPLAHAERMGARVVRGDFLTQPFPEPFDAVTFWAVLEHVSRPGEFLRRAAAILKPGGWCLVLTPNLRSLAVRLLGAKYRYIFMEHVNYFTPATLRALAAPEFAVAATFSTHFNPLVIWRDFRDGAREVPRAERSRLLKQTTACKQNPWLLPARLALGALERGLGGLGLADNVVVALRKEAAPSP